MNNEAMKLLNTVELLRDIVEQQMDNLLKGSA